MGGAQWCIEEAYDIYDAKSVLRLLRAYTGDTSIT